MPIVKDLNVFKNISGCFRPCPIIQPMNPFPLERGKETFGHGIIEAIPRATHAANDALGLQKVLKLLAGILAPAIRVVHEARSWSVSA